MSIETENKLDRIIQLLEELLQEVKKPSIPTQGEDTEWHNPENVSIGQLGQGYRFLKPWEVNGRYGADAMGISDAWKDGSWDHYCDCKWKSVTYRVPSSTPIRPKP